MMIVDETFPKAKTSTVSIGVVTDENGLIRV